MRLVYFVRNMAVGGGVKVLLQHVRLLQERGFDASLLTLHDGTDGWFPDAACVIAGPHDSRLKADVCVGTKPSDIPWLYGAPALRDAVICHLCQGDDVGDLRSRLQGLLTWRQIGAAPFRTLRESATLYHRLNRYERAYRLPTKKMAVSAHLCQLLRSRYGQPCVEVTNGVDLHVFHQAPRASRSGRHAEPWRLVSIGRYDTATKGIQDVLECVRLLREEGRSVHLTRIAGETITEAERSSGLIDMYRRAIPEQQVVEVLRESDVLLAGSREAEGFGLPALEAMACGVPCVLTAVPCYLGFDAQPDFAHFVPPRDPRAMADGVRRLMEDDAYRAHLTTRGLAVAETHSLERLGRSLVQFFDGLARAHASRAPA